MLGSSCVVCVRDCFTVASMDVAPLTFTSRVSCFIGHWLMSFVELESLSKLNIFNLFNPPTLICRYFYIISKLTGFNNDINCVIRGMYNFLLFADHFHVFLA